MSLATEIKEARVKLGLSQSQAAKAWDIPVRTLQTWEQEQASPRGLALKTLRQILASVEAKPAAPASSASPVPPDAPAAPKSPRPRLRQPKPPPPKAKRRKRTTSRAKSAD